jgi:mannose-6-phosphate isomerase-like protein (cupin superfamily)
MNVTNIEKAKDWFEVLQTSERSQTAMMTLGDEHPTLKKGDVITIPAGVKHRFTNRAAKPAVTFNVYSPPAYPAG